MLSAQPLLPAPSNVIRLACNENYISYLASGKGETPPNTAPDTATVLCILEQLFKNAESTVYLYLSNEDEGGYLLRKLHAARSLFLRKHDTTSCKVILGNWLRLYDGAATYDEGFVEPYDRKAIPPRYEKELPRVHVAVADGHSWWHHDYLSNEKGHGIYRFRSPEDGADYHRDFEALEALF
ncbi:MAG: hypothetical protein JWL82_64 [Parcubacteria group bacterium]|nr:hypothetical protein [Parcubacteria group bacterium]